MMSELAEILEIWEYVHHARIMFGKVMSSSTDAL
jgi:hypothetical protein